MMSAEMKRMLGSVVAASLLWTAAPRAQTPNAGSLTASLRRGGYVLVMRHASSPREAPDLNTANPDNVSRERQLDDAGRTASVAMGNALRALKIPIGDVLSSPTYRALETVRLAQLPGPRVQPELGDGGQSMQSATEAQGMWLRARATQLPAGTNTLIVTHMPNITRAFPEWGAVADGEAVVLGPDGKGGAQPIGRIRIEDWPRLAP